MNNPIKYLVTAAFIALCIPLFGQFSISGTVLDKETNEPVIGAEIHLLNQDRSETSSKLGHFTFSDLYEGNYTLVVFSFQYQTLTRDIFVDKNIEEVFPIEVLNENLSAVVINAQKEELFALKRLRSVEGTAIYAGKKK